MLSGAIRYKYSRIATQLRYFSDKIDKPATNKNDITPPKPEHPFTRTTRILKNDMKKVKNFFKFDKSKIINPEAKPDPQLRAYEDCTPSGEFQTHCDILIIGGGGVGSSIAYWLKKRARQGLHVVVAEKDSTYQKASTPLSVGGLRQQFSLEENIEMSLYGADFLRNIKENFENDTIDVNFIPNGYLVLSTEESADQLERNSKLQNEMGARNELLTAKQLKNKFPWLNTDGIALGCHGLEKEGWFDPWALLCGYKQTAIRYGAHYENCEVVGFEYKNIQDMIVDGLEDGGYEGLDKAIVRLPNGEIRTIKFAICVIAAGANSGVVGEMARIGTGKSILQFPLPVVPRKRYVYVFDTQKPLTCPGLNCPLVIDPTNAYFRKDGLGGSFIAGKSPTLEEEPPTDNLDVDYSYFDTDVWPHIAHRVPGFEQIKVKSAWAGYYEQNTFDENGIIGPHPFYHNLYIATGFSGHGIQQTPAVGRAISELIIDGDFQTIDLTRLCFDRILVNQPMYEVNIV